MRTVGDPKFAGHFCYRGDVAESLPVNLGRQSSDVGCTGDVVAVRDVRHSGRSHALERKRLRAVRGADANVVREFAVHPHGKRSCVGRGTKVERQHVTRGGNACRIVLTVQQRRDLGSGGGGVGGSGIGVLESTALSNVVDAIVFNLAGQIHRVGIVLRDAR